MCLAWGWRGAACLAWAWRGAFAFGGSDTLKMSSPNPLITTVYDNAHATGGGEARMDAMLVGRALPLRHHGHASTVVEQFVLGRGRVCASSSVCWVGASGDIGAVCVSFVVWVFLWWGLVFPVARGRVYMASVFVRTKVWVRVRVRR
jgi:hypothetical protein